MTKSTRSVRVRCSVWSVGVVARARRFPLWCATLLGVTWWVWAQLEGQKTCIVKIEAIQQRLRENIKGLDKCQGQSEKLLSRYLGDLHDQEVRVCASP